ncbi:hypothetical protein [Bosea sp. UC22_33]|uniref:hypothetical protein n=1 Tax=Bosea sp. UC22_33 TaxID=3350165 RepID=UPI003672C32C
MAYGVDPSGFVLKRLPEILAEIEAANVATFGPGVIQTDQSPLGQLNGLHADIAASVWELALSVYQALDPDQAEGVNLDRIAKLRLLTRAPGESDIDFRNAITNAGRARIDMSDLSQALFGDLGRHLGPDLCERRRCGRCGWHQRSQRRRRHHRR